MATLCLSHDSVYDDHDVEIMIDSFIPIEEANERAEKLNDSRTEGAVECNARYFVLKNNYTKEEFYL